MKTSIIRHLLKTRFGQVHCRQAGDKSLPAIIVMHINQQSSALHIELLNALAHSAFVVAMDYPSHGMSDPIDITPTVADYADCAAEVMSELGVAKFTAMGEATGAAVAIELGIRHADRTDGVVLMNCPIYRDRNQAEQVHQELKVNLRPADDSGFPLTRTLKFMREVDPSHSPLHPDQSWMDRINLAQIEVGRRRWQALDALNAYDIGDALSELDRDTMLLMGEHFHYTSLIGAYKERLKRLVTAEVVQGARFGMAWEKADIVAGYVKAFLSRTRA